jgi:hypothetical protein
MSEQNFLRSGLSADEHCLKAGELEAVAEGRANADQQAHVAACARCTAEVEMLRSFLEATPEAHEVADVRAITRELEARPEWQGEEAPAPTSIWTRFWKPLAALGVAALAVGIFLNQPDSGFRPIDGNDTLRSTSVEILMPVGDLTAPMTELNWKAIPGAARYRVRLEEIDQTEVWLTNSALPQVAIPPAIQERMTDRKTLNWVVEAIDATGQTIARSTPQSFRVVRSGK